MSDHPTLVTLDDIERRHMHNHSDPYWQWIRLVVTLATGTLTVLVSLQGHYVPRSPLLVWLLVAAWAALALSIASGLVALTWSYRGPLVAADKLRQIRQQHGDLVATAWVQHPDSTTVSVLHQWSVRVMSTSFLGALFALCWFSGANLLR